MYLLRLFRLPNLLLIALTQFLIWYCIILPAYNTEYINTHVYPPHLSQSEFYLLVFATIIIAAAGNAINDVYDVHVDAINKPGKNVVGFRISPQTAKIISYILFGMGSLIGLALAVKKQVTVMGLLFPFSAVSLFMYASYYKRRMLLGNILIAFLSALVIVTVLLFEPHFFTQISIWLRGTQAVSWVEGWQIVLFYACNAFMISLVRELIKDAEDIDGDELNQCKTFPIRFGLKNTKALAVIFLLINLGLIIFFLRLFFLHNSTVSFTFLAAFFAIPYAALAYLIISATNKYDYSYASLFIKIIMLCGILTIIPFYYFFL